MHFQSFDDSLFGTVYPDMQFCASVLKLESLKDKLIELQPPSGGIGPGIKPPQPPLPKSSSITKGF